MHFFLSAFALALSIANIYPALDIHKTHSLSSFRSLPVCHLLKEVFSDPPTHRFPQLNHPTVTSSLSWFIFLARKIHIIPWLTVNRGCISVSRLRFSLECGSSR